MGIEFLITSLVVVISPGPGALLTVAAGLSGGARAAAVTALGCTLGIVPHLLAAVTGLAALLHASATAFDVLRYAGVAYLLYMGWATWRSPAALEVRADASARSTGGRIAEAMLVNLLNPIYAYVTALLGRNIFWADGSYTNIFGKTKAGKPAGAPEEAHAKALANLEARRAAGKAPKINA